MSLQFIPLVAGARSSTITITSNGIGSPQTFAANGTGQSGTPPPPPPPPPPSGLSVPSTLDLGSQAVGVLSAGTVLNVSNPGASAVTVTSVQTSSVVEFPILALTCGVVAAGANCSVTVGFKPQASGARSGTMTITSNGTGSPHNVTLSGTGTATAPVPTKVQVAEFFNAAFGHYFTRADPGEVEALLTSAPTTSRSSDGRQRTTRGTAQVAGTVPVCRFFTTPGTFGTKSSHFYTANAAECDGLKLNPDWQYEKIAVLHRGAHGGRVPGRDRSRLPHVQPRADGRAEPPLHHRFRDLPAVHDDAGLGPGRHRVLRAAVMGSETILAGVTHA